MIKGFLVGRSKLVLIWLVLPLLYGCGTDLVRFYFEDLLESGKATESSADQLAWKGLENLRKKKYGKAQEAFQKLIEQYPYSKHVILAELKLGDAYYLDKKYAEAAVAYEQFARLHPAHEAAPYALYQLGMSYFKMGEDVERDHAQLKKALSVFERLSKAYVGTPYATKAATQASLCKQMLAKHEIKVATFYYKRGKYTAAKKRLEYALVNYSAELFQINKLKEVEEMLKECQNKINAGAEKPSFWTRVGF
ncbi:MAG: outer membrane protein assembly factor BamD [Syntrophobacterales bacterium]|nr:outer membrane protein assembly factor BamD [Syntrophobacterales bacterium]